MKHGTPSQANRGPKNPGRSPRPRPPVDTETSTLTRQSVLQGPEERTMRPPHASSGAHPQEQTVTVGPWIISKAASRFGRCLCDCKSPRLHFDRNG